SRAAAMPEESVSDVPGFMLAPLPCTTRQLTLAFAIGSPSLFLVTTTRNGASSASPTSPKRGGSPCTAIVRAPRGPDGSPHALRETAAATAAVMRSFRLYHPIGTSISYEAAANRHGRERV